MTKLCTKCRHEKHSEAFSRRSSGHLQSWCRACLAQYTAEQRRAPAPTEDGLPDAQFWELVGGSGEGNFASEEERHAAWEAHRFAVIDAARDGCPGQRPLAWWDYEAERPEHLDQRPLDPPQGEPKWGPAHGRAIDDFDTEPVLFLASRGELTEDEVTAIRQAALDASERVGTDRERRGTTYSISQDRSAVRLAIRMDAALGESGGEYGTEEPPYTPEVPDSLSREEDPQIRA